MAVISKRFGKYSLTVHSEKTKRIDFRSPIHSDRHRENASKDDENRGNKPETFDLLGFTHDWGKTRKGGWAVKRKTMKSRLARSIQSISPWCRKNMHKPVREPWEELKAKVRGHDAYYGITGNFRFIGGFRYLVERRWKEWLNRRNRENSMTWKEFSLLLKRYPWPPPKIVHSIFKPKKSG